MLLRPPGAVGSVFVAAEGFLLFLQGWVGDDNGRLIRSVHTELLLLLITMTNHSILDTLGRPDDMTEEEGIYS